MEGVGGAVGVASLLASRKGKSSVKVLAGSTDVAVEAQAPVPLIVEDLTKKVDDEAGASPDVPSGRKRGADGEWGVDDSDEESEHSKDVVSGGGALAAAAAVAGAINLLSEEDVRKGASKQPRKWGELPPPVPEVPVVPVEKEEAPPSPPVKTEPAKYVPPAQRRSQQQKGPRRRPGGPPVLLTADDEMFPSLGAEPVTETTTKTGGKRTAKHQQQAVAHPPPQTSSAPAPPSGLDKSEPSPPSSPAASEAKAEAPKSSLMLIEQLLSDVPGPPPELANIGFDEDKSRSKFLNRKKP